MSSKVNFRTGLEGCFVEMEVSGEVNGKRVADCEGWIIVAMVVMEETKRRRNAKGRGGHKSNNSSAPMALFIKSRGLNSNCLYLEVLFFKNT